jgi:hypothetical protein
MSVKIRQRFRVTNRIGVEEGQHYERVDVDDGEVMATMIVVAGG